MHNNNPSSIKTKLWRDLSGPLLTVGVAAVIELLSRTAFKIPNPPAFLLLMVVFSGFRAGLRSGLISAAVAWMYIAYYFSIPQQPFHYTAENLRRVLVWFVTTPAIALMVGIQTRRVERIGEARSHALFKESLHRYAERLKILHEIDQAVLAAQSPEAVADAALRKLWQLIPYRRVSASLFDFGAQEVRVLATHALGSNPVAAGTRVPLKAIDDIDHTLEVLRKGKVHRMDLGALSTPSPLMKALLDQGVHYLTVLPLIAQGQLIGSLSLGLDKPDALTPEHIEMAREVADQLALAIQQARLREQVREHAADLQRRQAELLKSEEQRRLSEEAWRASEERFRLIVTAANDALWDWDCVKNHIWRGPGFRLLFGYSEQEVESTLDFWRVRIHPEDADRVGQSLQTFLAGSGHLWSVEYRFRRADGSYATVLDRGYALRDATGKPMRVVGAIIDVTQQRRVEEAARAQEAAEEANRAKSEFLSGMSHELRTPLNAVLGFAQLLEMDSITPEQLDSVEQILKAGRHLLDLINEVLDISRIEAGRLSLSLEPVSLLEQIRESVALVVPLAQRARIQLEADMPEQDIYVLADRQRLKQVLLNLLSNAVKFNTQAGRVVIACKDVATERVRVKVTDTGPGIPPEKLPRLFTPFERLGMDQVEGTGLGLALSKALVEAMSGTLSVESAVGKGSTFCVELQRTEEPVKRLEAADGPLAESRATSATRSFTVLYVEDNFSNLKLVERIVAKRPEIRLLSAMQGSLALDLAKQHRPDIILLDLHLPDLPGHEVLQRLRQHPSTCDIPVVVITADAMPSSRERLVTAGSQGYLTKPLDAKQFLAALDEHLRG